MQNHMPSYLLSSIEILFICWPSGKKTQEKTKGIFLKLPFPPPQWDNHFSSNPRGCPQNSALSSFYFPPSKTVSPSFGHKAGEAVLAHKTPADAVLTGHRPGARLPTASLLSHSPILQLVWETLIQASSISDTTQPVSSTRLSDFLLYAFP